MIHPKTELKFISTEKGYGVVAKEFIPKGTITWVQDKLDRVFSDNQVEKMDDIHKEIIEHYSFRNNKGNYILCWDNGKYVNHSFKSNCLTTPYDFEIAVQDINVGEELTDDYGYLNIEQPFKALPEKGSKRKTVYPNDLTKYFNVWDKQINESIKHLRVVDQPLGHLLPIKIKRKINRILEGKQPLESILNCYYQPKKPTYNEQ